MIIFYESGIVLQKNGYLPIFGRKMSILQDAAGDSNLEETLFWKKISCNIVLVT